MHIFTLRRSSISHTVTLLMIISRLVLQNVISFSELVCLLVLHVPYLLSAVLCRKIWMRWIQIASINVRIMGYLKGNSFLLALISCTKWIQRSSTPGNVSPVFVFFFLEQFLISPDVFLLVSGVIFSNACQTVHFGFSDSQLLVK